MINVTDKRTGSQTFAPEQNVDIVIISNSVITVNGKYIIRTALNDWVRQDAVYTEKEIDASKQVIKRLNANRK